MADTRNEPESKPVQPAQQSARIQPSGYRGDNPSTAGPGNTGIRSATPENSAGELNPSAPGDTGTTPGSNAQ